MKNYKIAVAGTGYVGLSLSVLLAQHNQVTAVDIVQAKVDMINNHRSPIQDDYIEKYLAEKELNLTATLDAKSAYSDADFVVIAAPTNYDSKTQHFDTSAVEAVIKLVMEYNPNAVMVIKSTIPVGYTASVREKFGSKNIIFSPEFLRESKALYDNLYAIVCALYNYKTHAMEFKLITDKNDRDAARGSKYVQSKPATVFRQANHWLKEHPEKNLLFVGMGCQADGFRKYTETVGIRDRVWIADIVCHGSPSPKLWREYAGRLEKKYRGCDADRKRESTD